MALFGGRALRDPLTFLDGFPDTFPASIGTLGYEQVVRIVRHYAVQSDAGRFDPRRSPRRGLEASSDAQLVFGVVSHAHQMLFQQEYPHSHSIRMKLGQPCLSWVAVVDGRLLPAF